MTDDRILKAIKEQLQVEQAELQEAESLTAETYPIFSKLEKRDILTEVRLLLKLFGLDKEYRLAVYYLFRIAVEKGPEGSFIILDPKKARALANPTQKERIEAMNKNRLETLCSIINHVNQRELTKPANELINAVAKALSSQRNLSKTI